MFIHEQGESFSFKISSILAAIQNPRRDELLNFALGALPGGQDHGYQHQILF